MIGFPVVVQFQYHQGKRSEIFRVTQTGYPESFSSGQENRQDIRLEMIFPYDFYKELSDAALIGAIVGGDLAAFVYLLIGRCSKRLKFLVNNNRYREMKITLDELFSEVLIILKKNDFRVLRLFRGFKNFCKKNVIRVHK
jgi:hypothetical protein